MVSEIGCHLLTGGLKYSFDWIAQIISLTERTNPTFILIATYTHNQREEFRTTDNCSSVTRISSTTKFVH